MFLILRASVLSTDTDNAADVGARAVDRHCSASGFVLTSATAARLKALVAETVWRTRGESASNSFCSCIKHLNRQDPEEQPFNRVREHPKFRTAVLHVQWL